MKLEDLRQNLLKAAGEARSYVFLQAAVGYLEKVPDDDPMRLLMVRHFAGLGLIGPALELIDDHPPILAVSPELEELVNTLRTHPTGRIDWAKRTEIFEKNLECVLERFESARRHESMIRRAVQGLDLYQCRDGNYLLSRRVGDQPRRWLPGIFETVQTARSAKLSPEPGSMFCYPYLIEGVGFGEGIRGIYDGTRKMFLTFTPGINVIEKNCAQFAVWLHLDDHRDVLADPGLQLWIGRDAAEAFVRDRRKRPAQELPRAVVRQLGWAAAARPSASHALDTLIRERNQREDTLHASIRKALPRTHGFEYYANRFRNRHRDPLRIFGVTSRFTTFLQYSMRDIQQSLENMGHAFRLSIEEDDHTPNVPSAHILSQIESFRPDLILLIDHNRHEFQGLYDFKIPFGNWIQDDLENLFAPGAGGKLGPYDLVVGNASRSRLAPVGYPDAQRHPVPIPVNHRMFSNDPVSAADLRKLECDVSFVSNLSITPDAFLGKQLQNAPQPEIRRLLHALYETFKPRIRQGWVPGSFRQTAGMIQQIGGELGLHLSTHEAHQVRREFVDRLINIFYRQQVLHWASEMGLNLHLYGNAWEKHPTLGKHAKGIAEHGYHSRCIFQASKINLQLMPSAAVHQRLLEGLASGGFFLIRQTTFDMSGALTASVARECHRLNIRTEAELWDTDDVQLRQKVRELNDLLYAPKRLRSGLVGDLRAVRERGYSLEACCYLPHYDEVRFAGKDEFARLVARFLKDPDARRQIAVDQRQRVIETLTYDAVLDSILEFAATYFASRAQTESRLGVNSPEKEMVDEEALENLSLSPKR